MYKNIIILCADDMGYPYEHKYKEEQHANQLFVKKEEYDFYLPY